MRLEKRLGTRSLALRASWSVLWLVACAPEARLASNAAPTAPLSMPGPSPRGRSVSEASALNATCTQCHASIAAERRESFHARSATDAAYQRAFALEPLPFCQGCHAPETSAFEPVPDLAASLGVGCVTCHVSAGHLLGSSATSACAAPHAVARTAAFSSAQACAACHEFAFPERAKLGGPVLMQATITEHESSSARGVACATCHMPSVGEGAGRHRSHAFPGGHDAAFVKNGLAVSAERLAGDRVRLVLVTQGVAHAFPTGDLFRRLEVSAEAVGSDFQVVSSAQRYLARHWSEDRSSKPRSGGSRSTTAPRTSRSKSIWT